MPEKFYICFREVNESNCIKTNFGVLISNGHSPQICQNGKLLVRMCRGESHFSQISPLVNVGESGQSRLANVDECIRSKQSRLVNVDKCIESGQSGLANVDECIESDQNRLGNVCESGMYLPSLGKCWPMIR
jgi:hypothetical protein